MANFTEGNYHTREAGADLTGKTNYVVKLDTDGNIVLSALGANQHVGVLQTEGVDGENVSFRTVNAAGTGKVILGGTVSSRMTELTSDTAGKAVGASSGDWVFGLNLDTGVANDVVEYMPVYYKKA